MKHIKIKQLLNNLSENLKKNGFLEPIEKYDEITNETKLVVNGLNFFISPIKSYNAIKKVIVAKNLDYIKEAHFQEKATVESQTLLKNTNNKVIKKKPIL